MTGRARGDRVLVLFAGGGTGGHLYPALALAEALGELRPDVDVAFAGAERGIEARILPQRGLDHFLLPVRGFARGVPAWRNIGVIPALLGSVVRVGEWVHRRRPAAVVVTGGYAGGPAGIVAAIAGIPLALQEQNAVPGATTRALSRWAAQVHVAYPEAATLLPSAGRDAARVSGNPIRPPTPVDPREARGAFGLAAQRPVVLVVGGSQGSSALNSVTLDAVRRTEGDPGYQLLWSTGPRHLAGIEAALVALGAPSWVHTTGYIDDMPRALAAADVAISRAGAMATSELLAWGIPAILVPLPSSAAGHQERNARALAAAGCAIHAPEAELDGGRLGDELRGLLADPDRRDRMGAAALARALPDAARDIARDIASLLPRPRPNPRPEQGAEQGRAA
jgi:UDP-N-acetylglucosamine--N-acetylmuramyl-(pentapeptide) pyrophosphoryl-undecaprenol N-acetylglucosamine transferase